MACSKCSKLKKVEASTHPVSSTGGSSIETVTSPHSHIVDSGSKAPMVNVKTLGEVKSLNVVLPPSEAPDITVIRDASFKDTLVEVDAAVAVKEHCEPAPEETKTPCSPAPIEAACLNSKTIHSTKTQGSDLPHIWTDAVESEEITILGRVGRKLAKLVGEGVLMLDCKGKVRAVRDVPLRVTHLWHKWIRPTPTSAPVIGQPMPFSYQIIADLDGNPYPIRGLAEEDSITVWSHEEQQFDQRPVSDFPTCVREQLQPTNRLELVGFDPVMEGGDSEMLRCLKKIDGEGVIVFKKVPTSPVDICDCGDCAPTGQVQQFTTVAEFVPKPNNGCLNILTCDKLGDVAWQTVDQIEERNECCCGNEAPTQPPLVIDPEIEITPGECYKVVFCDGQFKVCPNPIDPPTSLNSPLPTNLLGNS